MKTFCRVSDCMLCLAGGLGLTAWHHSVVGGSEQAGFGPYGSSAGYRRGGQSEQRRYNYHGEAKASERATTERRERRRRRRDASCFAWRSSRRTMRNILKRAIRSSSITDNRLYLLVCPPLSAHPTKVKKERALPAVRGDPSREQRAGHLTRVAASPTWRRVFGRETTEYSSHENLRLRLELSMDHC